MKRFFSLLICALASASLFSAIYYASPSGTGDGSSQQKAGNFSALLKKLRAGDTLYLLAGQYDLQKTSFANGVTGDAQNEILISNAPGTASRSPILDFRTEAYGERGLQLNEGNDYIHIKGLTLRYSGKNALHNSGSNNTFEDLDVYGNGDTGVQMKAGGGNMIINVDSHDNCDYQLGGLNAADFGGNADGFADKQYTGGANTYIGCRAWNNSDDGWDFFQRQSNSGTPTKLIDCICYKNGPQYYDFSNHGRRETDKQWFDQFINTITITDKNGNQVKAILNQYPNLGNGNGFKLGGDYTGNPVQLQHCLAVSNTVKGFDQNNNFGDMTLYNCTAYLNGTDYGFNNNSGGTLVIRNCLSYKSKSNNVFRPKNLTTDHNSWNTSGISVSDNDFLSLDTALILTDRDSDGNLPETAFLRLREGSKLIDAGVDVGLSYVGKAPDIGCYEYGSGEIILPATLTLTSGTLSQTLRLGDNMTPVVLTWGGSAENVSYTDLPDGIDAEVDTQNKTITFLGEPLSVGTYSITVSTTGNTSAKQLTITLIVKPAGSGYNVAYITIPDDDRDRLILNRLNNDPWFDITIVDANKDINTGNYDLLVISPVPGSTASGLAALKTIDRPTLLLKPFMLKQTVWNWGNSVNTTDKAIQVSNTDHLIFKGITLEADNTLTMFSRVETNGVTAINGWYSSTVAEIAAPQTATGQTIVEASAGTNMNGTSIKSDFMMIGVSEYSTAYLTDAATQLIDNACRYLLGLNIDTTVTNLTKITPIHDDVVYTILGVAVGKGQDSIRQLPAGMYIYNGELVIR